MSTTYNMSQIRKRRSSNTSSGEIQLILGPMFSGKSTELMRRIKRYQIARYSCLIVKYANDNRYNDGEYISTHDRQTLQAVKATTLMQFAHKIDLNTTEFTSRSDDVENEQSSFLDLDVIGVDEGQFFSDIVEFSEVMANLGKTVIVAALDGTFQRKGFENIMNLVPLSESVIKLSAVCMICFGEASYTKRISSDQEIEVIGGTDMYMSTCRKCHAIDVSSVLSVAANGESCMKPTHRSPLSHISNKLMKKSSNMTEPDSSSTSKRSPSKVTV